MLIPQTGTSALASIAKWLFAVCLLPVYNIYRGAEWFLLAVLACVIADYRLGRGECRKRQEAARQAGDKEGMARHEWRRSRAWRRTLAKTGDYFLIVTVGVFVGHAFLPLFGVSCAWGPLVATAACCACETVSVAGHFLYLRGVEFDPQDIRSTLTRFIVALARRKSPDLGGALGDALGKGRAPGGGGTDERGDT